MRLFGVMLLFFCILTSTAAAADKITAVRTIGTASVNPGEIFQVTVVLTGGDEDLIGIALDEDLPDGWVVETVQDMVLAIELLSSNGFSGPQLYVQKKSERLFMMLLSLWMKVVIIISSQVRYLLARMGFRM